MKLEQRSYVPNKMKSPSYTAELNREKITDWIAEASSVFDFTKETLLLAINILDRVLGLKKPDSRNWLLGLGVASLHLAAKY